ncbi:MAG: hypothetical protein MUP70_11235, partial [Candidatus Aminicenantes bacterium]|nr:hypothetical protein [Candidatus Aminicenantes bacterium]
IKPTNIMWDGQRAVILDYGASQWLENVYDIREMDRIIIWTWTKKSSKIPMKITRRNGWENPVGCPAGRRHAANESN